MMGAWVGGISAGVLTHPLDTAKTRIQADVSGKIYNGLLSTIQAVQKEGGTRLLFKGVVPRTSRSCGAAFVVLQIRDIYLNFDWSMFTGLIPPA